MDNIYERIHGAFTKPDPQTRTHTHMRLLYALIKPQKKDEATIYKYSHRMSSVKFWWKAAPIYSISMYII